MTILTNHIAAGGDNNVDLHNKEFCVDVSTYQPVVWQEVDAEQCDTVFVKQCEDKTEDVCADVTETRCQVRGSFSNMLAIMLIYASLNHPLSSASFPKLIIFKAC